jgi:hypothetical protein
MRDVLMKRRDWAAYWAAVFAFITAMTAYMHHATTIWNPNHWQYWVSLPTLTYMFCHGVIGLLRIHALHRAEKRQRQSID